MADTTTAVPVVNPASPEEFYEQYVRLRRPCILRQHQALHTADEWRIMKWANLDYLVEKAGDAVVQVDRRPDDKTPFGTNILPRTQMKFSELISELKKGNVRLYLTTQYEENLMNEESEQAPLDDESDDKPDDKFEATRAIPPPLRTREIELYDCLLDDFPIKPKLFGNLILQQVNLWVGHSPNGATSGLHHDYHDNLYCLIRGKKRFTLFSPEQYPNLYTSGTVSTLHPNGLINYEDQPTRADGAPLAEVAKYHVAQAEAELEQLKSSGADPKEIQKAEKKLEQALETMLEAEMEEEDFDGDEDFDEDESEISTSKSNKRKRQSNENLDDQEKSSKRQKNKEIPPPLPSNFSRVPYQLVHSEEFTSKNDKKNISKLEKEFPLFLKAKRMVAELQPGDLLYLPASWFHEVSSYSDSADGVHIALNYWMHPPDGNSYQQPYADNVRH